MSHVCCVRLAAGAFANAAFNFIPRSVGVAEEEKCARMFHSFLCIAVDLLIFLVPVRFDVRHVPVMCFLAEGVFFRFRLFLPLKRNKNKTTPSM